MSLEKFRMEERLKRDNELLSKRIKQPREQRIKERKENPKSNPTTKDIMEMLNDLADRQSEIYDLLKAPK